ncbi:hypothetical protein ABU614_00630 [Lysobacter firmicutimachus]|uniref:tetratricopeptide repeat protein n=1 Tax=Lysobacter firmicutimachus TaxID=1792846 RepID=UPI00342C658E
MTSATDDNTPSDFMAKGEECLEKGLRAEAIAYLTVAGLSGEWDAWLRISQILETETSRTNAALSLHFRKKYQDAIEFAATAGDNNAAHRLAGLLEFGQPGLTPDQPRALSILEGLAESGDPSAQFELFEKHLYGLCGAPKDKTIALKWLRFSANNGHQEAKKWLQGMQTWEEQGFEYPRPSQEEQLGE